MYTCVCRERPKSLITGWITPPVCFTYDNDIQYTSKSLRNLATYQDVPTCEIAMEKSLEMEVRHPGADRHPQTCDGDLLERLHALFSPDQAQVVEKASAGEVVGDDARVAWFGAESEELERVRMRPKVSVTTKRNEAVMTITKPRDE
jgi:hypothetical protein